MVANSYSVYTSFKAKDGMSNVFKNMKNRATGFGGQLEKLKTQAQSSGDKMKNSFLNVKSALVGIMTVLAANTVKQTLDSWVEKASDLQETLGKTNETFKTNSSEVIAWSKQSIKSMGLAQQTALDTAALYGDMGTGMGMTTKRASEMATSLTQLSADIASFKNVDQSLSANALKGIFTGETEALKNLGTVMTQENLEDYAKKMGLNKKFKDMSQTEKIELRYKYVMASNKNAQGDFLRTGGNYANQSRIVEEQKKQLETNLGSIMLPKYNAVMKSLNAILIKYSPTIEKGFGALFKNFEEGVKICSPLFEHFQSLVKVFATTVMPLIQSSMPIIKNILESMVVPALIVVIDTITETFRIIKWGFVFVKNLYSFIKDNWLPLLGATPLAIMGVVGAMRVVQTAIDIWRLKMALLRMEGGLFSVLMQTKLVQSIGTFASAVWKSVTALAAQTAAFLMSPVGLITLGIVGLVSVVVLLWKNWDKVTGAFKKFAQMYDNFKKRHPKIFGNSTKSSVEIQGANGKDVKNKTVKQNKKNKNGRIDIGVKVDSPNANTSTTLDLENPSGMTLIPNR